MIPVGRKRRPIWDTSLCVRIKGTVGRKAKHGRIRMLALCKLHMSLHVRHSSHRVMAS